MASTRAETDKPICCVGLGWVGLFTTLSLCEEGYDVVAVDIDPDVVDAVNAGKMHINIGLPDADIGPYVADDHLVATTHFDEQAADADTYVISVPTPIDGGKKPDVSYIREAARSIADVLAEGDLVVLQSTTYPGCCREVLIPHLEDSGLTAEEDFGVSYVPERYTPGDPSTMHIPRVVGSISAEWQGVTRDLYESICESIVTVSSLAAAEATKLIENVQRDVNIGLVNEFDKVCHTVGLDTHEIIEAASTKWNFHRYEPGLGVGGHCIPIDPYFFMSAARDAGCRTEIMATARSVNEGMPGYYCNLIVDSLDEVDADLGTCEVAVLGLTYKPGVRDVRNSPALLLIELLASKTASLRAFDPMFDPGEPISDTELTNEDSLTEAVAGADVVIVGMGHESFADHKETIAEHVGPDAVIIDPYRVVQSNKRKFVEAQIVPDQESGNDD